MPEDNIPKDLKQVVSDPNINYFAMTNYRNAFRKFGAKIDDRRRHMYVVGKTGMGKTTLLENMVLNDIYAGHGVGLVDPHGDFAEKIIDYIPPHRINDVVYFNPADMNYPIGFNILETVNPEHKHLVASGLMGVFKKIWPDVWSARMEYILNNTILALLDYPDTTLLGINRLLADDAYREKVVKNLQDPVVRAFWETEFANYNDKYKQEAVAPIQNKIGQFLSASIIRNIVAQVKSRINIREIMDTRKIFIMNLSKGRVGEDNSRLLGGMLITKIQLSAMERVDTPEKDRKDFFLYVDEFQNFATESFANILSEARKYRLGLIMAHQYMEQLDESVLAAVIGNVGSLITYRVGSTDAAILVKEFTPTFTEEDLVNLPKFNIYLKLMIDGVSSRPFSALTLPPIGSPTGSTEKVIRVTHERYGTSREKIEEKIKRWSGLELGLDDDDDLSAPLPVKEEPKKLGDFLRKEYDDDEMFKDEEIEKRKTENALLINGQQVGVTPAPAERPPAPPASREPRRDNSSGDRGGKKFGPPNKGGKKPDRFNKSNDRGGQKGRPQSNSSNRPVQRPAPRPLSEIIAEEAGESRPAPIIKLGDLKIPEKHIERQPVRAAAAVPVESKPAIPAPTPPAKDIPASTVKPGQVVDFDA